MPRNKFSFAKYIRELYLRRLCEAHAGITFRLGSPETARHVGIHLLAPEQWELDRAIERAEAQGFETIYIYV